MLVAVVYLSTTLLAPIPATAAVASHETSIVQPEAQLDWPAFGSAADCAVGYSGVLAAHGPETSVPIASITKTITALVVLDARPIPAGQEGAPIDFSDADVVILGQVQANDGSWAPVVAGSSLTERQTLEAMLLPSANNYAISLATWAFGSVDAYLPVANAWLAAHRLTHTHVADASGLNPRSVSSTSDLIQIGKLVLADPTLSAIVGMQQANLPAVGLLKNTNSLLGRYGIDGIKTGSTDEAGECLLFSADLTVGSQRVTVVGAVLGAPDHKSLYAAVGAFLISVKSGFHDARLSAPGQTFASYTTAWGTSAKLVTAQARSVLVWSDTPVMVATEARATQLAASGATVGSVNFTIGRKTITEPLRVKAALTGPDAMWRILHPAWLDGYRGGVSAGEAPAPVARPAPRAAPRKQVTTTRNRQ